MNRKKILVNHIKGMIYGQALGDAVGLTTEFKFKRDRPDYTFPYKDSIRKNPVCDWTDDTDQMILIMESIIESDHDFISQPLESKDLANFAAKLGNWKNSGFPELGDKYGMGLGGNTNMVLIHPQFGKKLYIPSAEIWINSGKRLAPNGAIMRTSILAILHLFGKECPEYWETIKNYCEITHYDIRCIISCWVLVESLRIILRLLISGKQKLISGIKKEVHKTILNIIQNNESLHTHYPQTINETAPVTGRIRHQPTPKIYAEEKWFTENGKYKLREELSYYFNCNLEELELDELGKIGYTYKCMGCSIWALDIISSFQRKKNISRRTIGSLNFKKIINAVVKECGDADTNAAVVGAIIGAFIGYDQLPTDWLQALPNKDWLDKKIDDLLIKMKLI
jgi:ADP-ribosylglycohydrolase